MEVRGFTDEIPPYIYEAAENAPVGSAGILPISSDGTSVLLGGHTIGKPFFENDYILWGPFAGKREPGESPHQTAIRECREELGIEFDLMPDSPRLELRIVRTTWEHDEIINIGKGVIYIVIADINTKSFIPNSEISQIRWFNYDQYMQCLYDWYRPDLYMWGPRYTFQLLDFWAHVRAGNISASEVQRRMTGIVTTINYSPGSGWRPWDEYQEKKRLSRAGL